MPNTPDPLAVRPHDRLMLECPLPQPLDDVMLARLLLLQERGLLPQVFLPDLPGLPDALGSGPGPMSRVDVPAEVMATLGVMVMEPARLAAALEGDAARADDLSAGLWKTTSKRVLKSANNHLYAHSGAWGFGPGDFEHADAAARGAGHAA